LANEPQNALAWYNKGVSLAELSRNEEAIWCYDQALAIDPRFAQAHQIARARQRLIELESR
jgi:tetratricopeptide (TPR) repeat protein